MEVDHVDAVTTKRVFIEGKAQCYLRFVDPGNNNRIWYVSTAKGFDFVVEGDTELEQAFQEYFKAK